MAEITSMSRGQKNYLQKLRRDSQIVRLIRILIFLVFLALWEGSARLGLIDSFIFSSPSQVVMAMYHMMKSRGLTYGKGRHLCFSLIIDKISTDWETYPVTETLFDKNRRQNYENFIF